MHGGGQSTMTRDGAISAVKLYTGDFIKIAEAQHLIVVFPSTNGLNWGGHTRVLLRELAKLMRTELPIDANSIALIGHSMGGMGITRNAFFLGDQFKFMMPVAAGMDPKYMTEVNLLTLFNAAYHHVQGLNDEFAVFVDRAKMHEAKMKELETKLGKPSLFELTLTNTGHNYDLNQLNGIISAQFAKSIRNLYQSDLYGSFYYGNQIVTDNNIQYNFTSTPEYFWLEAKEFTAAAKATLSPFEAHITGNQIAVTFKGPHNVKTMRVYLSNKMLNLGKPISILVNGKSKLNSIVDISKSKTAEIIAARSDTGFVFDQYVDLDVSDSQN